VWELASEPEGEYEVRLCVKDCINIPSMDVEGTSDVYICAFIDDDNVKTTDTHYRCMNGKPSWSFRMLFNVKTPREQTKLVLQAFDRDIFSSNEFICEWELDMEDLMNVVKMTKSQAHLNKRYYETR
jgi:Ca2+-dependent lipid-binding protein